MPRLLFTFSLTLLLGLSVMGAKRVLSPDGPSYLTAVVARGDLKSAVMATGTLQAHQQVDVGAQVTGQVKTLKVKLGDRVKKGQLLAELDPVLPQNALRSAQANLDSLEAQHRAIAASLWQADLNLKRQQKMLTRDATSRQDLEAAKAQAQVQRANLASFAAQISQARAQVATAQANLAYTQITAPMDGEVVAIVTQEGQTVLAAQQAPVILKLARLDTMTVRAQISEADVIRIQPGQSAYFTILGDAEHRHSGTLRAIEPAPQEYATSDGKSAAGPVFYNALFETENPDRRLRIGMTAQVTVVLSQARNALHAPLSALGAQSADGRYAVRVIGADGTPKTVMAAIGINDRVNAQILDGLKEGDRVVTADGAAGDPAGG